jgi:NADH-quinone oxidoreductase subunit G
VERCDAVLVLGEDATNTAPMLALALRQAAAVVPRRQAQRIGVPAWNDAAFREAMQESIGPVFVATAAPTKLDDAARRTFRGAPEEIARLGEAVAHALDASQPEPAGLSADARALAEEIAAALRGAERPLVVSGFGAGSLRVLEAAERAARAAGRARGGAPAEIFLTVPEANSVGLAALGGGTLEAAFAEVEAGRADTVLVLENDLHRRAAPERVEAFLERAAHVVALDHTAHATAAAAEVVLPVATFAEASGTVVSNEGRAQRFVQVFAPDPPVPVAWRWLRDVARAAGRGATAAWERLDDVTAAIAAGVPALAALARVGAGADGRPDGARPPRATHRQTGRTAAVANVTLHEPKPPEDPDSPFAFSMEGWPGPEPPSLRSEFWAAGWNSIQSLNRFQEEIGGPLLGGDPGVRLFEPGEGAAAGAAPAGRRDAAAAGARDAAASAAAAPAPRDGELRVVPLHHVHGSEELSALSPATATLVPEPYVALSPDDAGRRGLAAGDTARVVAAAGAAGGPGTAGGSAGSGADRARELRLPVRIVDGLAPRVAGLPAGLPGLPLPSLPDWCRVEKP